MFLLYHSDRAEKASSANYSSKMLDTMIFDFSPGIGHQISVCAVRYNGGLSSKRHSQPYIISKNSAVSDAATDLEVFFLL